MTTSTRAITAKYVARTIRAASITVGAISAYSSYGVPWAALRCHISKWKHHAQSQQKNKNTFRVHNRKFFSDEVCERTNSHRAHLKIKFDTAKSRRLSWITDQVHSVFISFAVRDGKYEIILVFHQSARGF